MSIQLYVGLVAEGVTDYRFLKPVVEKTLIEIAFECNGQIDIEVTNIKSEKGNSFSEYITNACKDGAEKYGISMLVVHADADESSSTNTYTNKIAPLFNIINEKSDNELCKMIAPLIPIYETESWMLSDKELIKKIIGTKKTDSELNINGNPETFNNPKERVSEAIRIGRIDMPKKMKNNLNISDLYSLIGESIDIKILKTLNSYNDFTKNIRNELIKLNLLIGN